jgi:hypothetical protein
MKQSESITDLASALCLAQAEMGGAVKDSNNPFFKSSYADLTSVIKVMKEPFARHGLSFVQLPVTSEGGRGVGVATMLMHNSGQWIQSEYLLPLDKVTAQGAGSAITYARRYALQAMAGIPAVDDDGESLMVRTAPPVVSPPPQKRVNKKLTQEVVALVVESQASGETSVLVEALGELEEHEKSVIWKQLTGEQQNFVRLTKEM